MHIKYYRERNGDYLMVVWDRQYQVNPATQEGRASAIAGLPNSVCTTGIGHAFLRDECTLVRKADVPKEWLEQF